MQKVDAVIAGVGAFALLATVLGVVFYEDLAGEQDITFPTHEAELTAQQGSSGTPLQFTLPDNATAATLDVLVRFTGQAGQGGQADVTIEVTGPNDFFLQQDETMTVAGANNPTPDETYTVPLFSWADVPEDVVGDPDDVDETSRWDEPLTVTVTVTPPTDPLGTLPQVSYTFTATVTPTLTIFSESTAAPEPAAA